MKAYLVDVGSLIKEGEREFEQYAIVYDKKYGYYDESQYHVRDIIKAMADATKYVHDSKNDTYAVVTETELPDDYDFNNDTIEHESYEIDSVVYSIGRIDGKIVENFVKKTA